MKYNLTAFSAKDIGGRNEQQDSVIHRVSPNNKNAMLVLADGMGGHSGGAVGSSCIISAAKEEWQHYLKSTTPKKTLNTILRQAANCMNKLEKENNISPRSTFVALLLKDTIAYYAHLGDSRLYHFRQGKLLTKTKDHSVVQMLVDMGNLPEEEMTTHEDQSKLLKWVGGKTHEPSFNEVEIAAGDIFLLCSDGLWEYVSIKKMEAAFQQSSNNLESLVNSLITQAKKAGEDKGDNISIALLTIEKKHKESQFRKILNTFIK